MDAELEYRHFILFCLVFIEVSLCSTAWSCAQEILLPQVPSSWSYGGLGNWRTQITLGSWLSSQAAHLSSVPLSLSGCFSPTTERDFGCIPYCPQECQLFIL